MTATDASSEPVARGRRDLAAYQAERPRNYFTADRFLQAVLSRHLGPELGGHRALLERVGACAAGPMEELARACSADHALPRLERFDGVGERREAVLFDPSYHRLGELFWASRVLALLAEPGHELVAGAVAYLLDHNGEAGHACPVACTAGAIKLIQHLGSDDQRRRYLPRLLAEDAASAWRAAQFVTEVQGGSDVGANACRATPSARRPGWYEITGEKWFCSVADADLFVVSARPDGASDGTRGLGLFLVPRLVDGRPNGFALRRLKTKLGTRAMATGEIDFAGALGEPIGPLDAGFKNLVAIVLDTSRVHNAVSACGAMARALVEARAFARHRAAFGVPIATFPAVQEILARMRLRSAAALAATFRVLAVSDRLARGEGGVELAAARRLDVMVTKYWTAIHATRVVRDAIEVLGGNGTVDDLSVLPRLYRDTIVIESWEGSHNTLCAQILRDVVQRRLDRPWLATVSAEVAALDPPERQRAEPLLARVRDRLVRAAAGDAAVHRAFRHVVDDLARLLDWVAIAQQLAFERATGHDAGTAPVAALLAALDHDRLDPVDDAALGVTEAAVAGRVLA